MFISHSEYERYKKSFILGFMGLTMKQKIWCNVKPNFYFPTTQIKNTIYTIHITDIPNQ